MIAIGLATYLAAPLPVRWEPREALLLSGFREVPPLGNFTASSPPLNLGAARNVTLEGWVGEAGGRPISFELRSSKVLVALANVSSHSFEVKVVPKELEGGVKLVVYNDRAWKLIEEKFLSDVLRVNPLLDRWCTEPKKPLSKPARKVPVKIRVVAREVGGRKFNIYVLDRENLDRLELGTSYEALYEGRNSSEYEFEFTVPPDRCDEPLAFVVERVVELEKRSRATTLTVVVPEILDNGSALLTPPFSPAMKGEVSVKCKVYEVNDKPFNLLVLNPEDFKRYCAGTLTLKPYFVGRRLSRYEFEFKLPPGPEGFAYFVVERAGAKGGLKVVAELEISWLEEYRPELAVEIRAWKSYLKPLPVRVIYSVKASWWEEVRPLSWLRWVGLAVAAGGAVALAYPRREAARR